MEWRSRYGQKARRAGHNFDPVGTARHRLARRSDPGDPATTARTRWTPWIIEGLHGPVPARTGTTATLEQGLDRLGRSPAGRPHHGGSGWPGYRRYQLTGRTDLSFTTDHTPPRHP
ncbi:hypothetical protein [Brachybacterium sp. P6-10-X1]|uniref:hypothetical protein n=1 Tax=Brachybacterium sp. P6-10-X1 TaxID=1903186 RepID=UPI0020A5ED06|nr:hypothetical protein [Brachybacterium sp. P6-10-X1]